MTQPAPSSAFFAFLPYHLCCWGLVEAIEEKQPLQCRAVGHKQLIRGPSSSHNWCLGESRHETRYGGEWGKGGRWKGRGGQRPTPCVLGTWRILWRLFFSEEILAYAREDEGESGWKDQENVSDTIWLLGRIEKKWKKKKQIIKSNLKSRKNSKTSKKKKEKSGSFCSYNFILQFLLGFQFSKFFSPIFLHFQYCKE